MLYPQKEKKKEWTCNLKCKRLQHFFAVVDTSTAPTDVTLHNVPYHHNMANMSSKEFLNVANPVCEQVRTVSIKSFSRMIYRTSSIIRRMKDLSRNSYRYLDGLTIRLGPEFCVTLSVFGIDINIRQDFKNTLIETYFLSAKPD